MNDTQKAAYVISQSVCAMIEAMGMQAENEYRIHRGETVAYTSEAFNKLLETYNIQCNSVIGFLNNHDMRPK